VLLSNRAMSTLASLKLQPAIIQARSGRLSSLTGGKEVLRAVMDLSHLGVDLWQLELK